MAELLYAVGDVHGCHDQLLAAVALIKAHAGARPFRVVFLGDYVDRGPKSMQVVDLVRDLVRGKAMQGTWRALRGNHEEMMIAAAAGKDTDQSWLLNGGNETLESYADNRDRLVEHLKWFDTLPHLITAKNHVFVHAGLSPRYALDQQPTEVMLWARGWERADHDFGKHVVYGHTPRDTPALWPRSTGLDTGACYGGPLSVGVFDPTKAEGPVEILQAS